MSNQNLIDEQNIDEEFCDLPNDYDMTNVNEYCYIGSNANEKYLSILKSKNFSYSKFKKYNYIQISQQYIVKKIILHNMPMSTYTLQLNGVDTLIFEKNLLDNDYQIDIEQSSSAIIDKYKSSCEKKSCINLMNIDNVRIIYDKNVNFDCDYIQYSLCGHKISNIDNKSQETPEINEINETNTKYKYYINTIVLDFNHPTKFINVVAKTKNPNKNGNIYLYVDGVMIKNIIVSENKFNNYCIRFDCNKNINKYYYGVQNNYLSNQISTNTINLSRVDHCQIACSNVEINYLTQFYFITYILPYMNQLYAD